MYEYFRKPKKSGYIDYGSFILCRTGKDYKINASICIIKSKPYPILFDVGLTYDMLVLAEKALKSINRNPKSVKIAIISHYHPDHIMNLFYIRRYFRNIRVVWHKNAYDNLNTIPHESTSYKKLNTNIKTIPNTFMYIPQYLEASIISRVNKNYLCKDGDFIPTLDDDYKLKVIHTPGHSSGHICLHDLNHKILYLGDHLPLTPWLDISEKSIDNMISSIKRLLKLTSKDVEYSVRGHGNLADNSREVYPWEQEKQRFEDHMELILETNEKILSLLKNQPSTIKEIAQAVLKNKSYMEYSSIMNYFFMPPNLSWIFSYLLKLRNENKIKQIGRKWVIA